MATNFTIKITPDKLLAPDGLPDFEIKIKSSGIFFTDYTWSCLPGYMGAVSGAAVFIDTGTLSLLILETRKRSVFTDDSDNKIYGMLSGITPDFTVGSKGKSHIDYSGYNLKKRLEGNTSILQMFTEFWLAKKTNTRTHWEVVEAN